jgi:predicted AlkP superfamily phosphohydrolase/phosphomutase
MSAVIFLGVDGLDFEFIERHIDVLPTLRGLRESGHLTKLESIFPPDSIPAWITIFTGEPPDQHGVVESIDYLAKNPAAAAARAPSFLSGRTFWDEVSRRGGRVCVVNPFMAYPSWPVNGVMISGPVFVDAGDPSVSPPGATDDLELPQLGGVVDFPNHKTIQGFLDRSLDVTRAQGVFGLDLLEKTQPDLFFMNILTIDRIQHFVWRYSDVGDPTYPGPTSLADGVLRAYQTIDEVIGTYLAAAGDGVVIVASDHGHGRRPTTMLYVDELLRRHGLFSTGGLSKRVRTYLLERAKRLGLRTAFRFGLEHEAYSVARRIPGRKALKTSSYAKAGGSLAFASRTFGRNSAGGVELSTGLAGSERERIVELVIDLLRRVRDEEGRELVEWVARRDELFDGPEASRFPDVLFQLREDLGVDFGVYCPLLGPDTMHRRVSGGHRRGGVFAASSPDIPFVPRSLSEIHELIVTATTAVRA